MFDIRNPITLKAARIAAGLSIAELARRSGVSRDTIENCEAGKYPPRMETMVKLEAGLV